MPSCIPPWKINLLLCGLIVLPSGFAAGVAMLYVLYLPWWLLVQLHEAQVDDAGEVQLGAHTYIIIAFSAGLLIGLGVWSQLGTLPETLRHLPQDIGAIHARLSGIIDMLRY